MKTKEIEVISEIVNFQRFSDAADSLSYSHSVISKYVTSAERELGIKLFVRGNKSSELSLTPEGKLLVPAIQRINNDYQYMLELIKQLKDASENVLRVGSTMRFGNITEQEVLASFMYGNPDVKLEQATMMTKDLLKMLKANRLDAIFIVTPGNIDIAEYLKDHFEGNEVDIRFIKKEKLLYVAVSDNFLPCVNSEAPFITFRDFTFAFPMMHGKEDSEIMNSAMVHANKSGFTMKTMFSSVYGSTIFRLAQKAPVAFLTTNIENFSSWIKFVRVSDWDNCFNVYFLTLKSNKKKMLQTLKRCCIQYAECSDNLT